MIRCCMLLQCVLISECFVAFCARYSLFAVVGILFFSLKCRNKIYSGEVGSPESTKLNVAETK